MARENDLNLNFKKKNQMITVQEESVWRLYWMTDDGEEVSGVPVKESPFRSSGCTLHGTTIKPVLLFPLPSVPCYACGD